MRLLAIPWLELTLIIPLLGSLIVALIRDVRTAFRWSIFFTGMTLFCATMVATGFYYGELPDTHWSPWSIRYIIKLDDLNALLLPLVALLHFLTALTTARTRMGQFSFAGLLCSEAVQLAAFACLEPWLIVELLIIDALLPAMTNRRKGWPNRLFYLHIGLFAALLVAGWACASAMDAPGPGSVLILLAVLIRTGMVPAHIWVSDLFEKGSYGMALLLTAPLPGIYAAVRLALPIAPEWTLETLGMIALFTALYAAGMGLVQTSARRFVAYLLVSHAALVMVGLGLHTPLALTGALVMWLTAALSLTGLGLTLRAVEGRVGVLNLNSYHGLYEQMPALAVGFLITGLAAVGFPGTSGFVAIELLVDEAVGTHIIYGLLVVLTTAINGIGVLRAYLLIFTGKRHHTGVMLGITIREQVAMLALIALIIGGGLLPQTYLESRQRAVRAVLHDQFERTNQTVVPTKKQH